MKIARALRRLVSAAVLALALPACDGVDDTDQQDVTQGTARFETFKGADGRYYFQLLAKNGERVLDSQSYASLASAKKGVASVKANGGATANYKVEQADNGEFYFNLIAGNGQVIGTSETYATKDGAQKGVTAAVAAATAASATPANASGDGFETFTGADGKTYFRLRAKNGEIVLQSQGYSSKSAAASGIDSVKTNGVDATHFDVVAGVNGAYSFRLLAANHKTIGRGEMYASKSSALRGADGVRDLLREIVGAGAPTAVDLKAEVEKASDGLLFMSESDYPFTFVSGALPSATAPITEALVRQDFGALVDADKDADKPMASNFAMTQKWEDWQAAEHMCADPEDPIAMEQCKKMRNLEQVLGANLTDIQVYYFGAHGSPGDVQGIGVTVFIVGRTTDGKLAGVKTLAIWT
ncbi:MAG: DUF1508 domain-containing protein [Polyangiaceae bacterium]